MKPLFGNYCGIVIQNNDPDRSGKVKVFVPHLTASVYSKWIEDSGNKSFKFLGNNIDSVITELISNTQNSSSNLTNVLNQLKNILPWAECAAPITGESSSGRFNNFNQFASISDSSFYSSFSSTTTGSDLPGKPGFFYEKTGNRLADAFTAANNNINRPNPLSYQYVPSTYSNRAKGSFGIPSVGSHVWVFFREGNPTHPVYFATTFGRDDWNGIYESYETGGIDYPGAFENKDKGLTPFDVNVETYRNKYVINQKGGSLEFINTDLKEQIKLTHSSGSFKDFNNEANIELATKNDQKLVLGDSYSTVQGFKNEYTSKNLDEVILRDKYVKVGNLNTEYFEQWKQLYATIQDNKQLFEIKRTGVNNITDNDGNLIIKRNSLMQGRSGTFAKHPVTSGSYQYLTLSNNADITVPTIANSSSNAPANLNVTESAPMSASFPPTSRYLGESNTQWGPAGVGFSTSTQNGNWDPDIRKDQIADLLAASIQQLVEIENNLGIGGSEIIQITKHKIETIGTTVNDFGSFRLDPIGKMINNEILVDDSGAYTNQKESPLVEYVHVQDLPGGTFTQNICNRYNLFVGSGGINIKTTGSLNVVGAITNIVGEQLNLASENELNIDGSTVNISANILRLRSKRQRQILVDCGLGVSNNVVIGGGLYVDGETFLQHVTAPTEYQVTEVAQVYAKLLTGLVFNATSNKWSGTATITLIADSNDDKVQCYDHSHAFKNLPLTLLDTNDQYRIAAKAINNEGKVVATKRIHTHK